MENGIKGKVVFDGCNADPKGFEVELEDGDKKIKGNVEVDGMVKWNGKVKELTINITTTPDDTTFNLDELFDNCDELHIRFIGEGSKYFNFSTTTHNIFYDLFSLQYIQQGGAFRDITEDNEQSFIISIDTDGDETPRYMATNINKIGNVYFVLMGVIEI